MPMKAKSTTSRYTATVAGRTIQQTRETASGGGHGVELLLGQHAFKSRRRWRGPGEHNLFLSLLPDLPGRGSCSFELAVIILKLEAEQNLRSENQQPVFVERGFDFAAQAHGTSR
jgi:hypothetical protein